jgi:A/G-specific adenine glycosylase
VRPSGKKSVNKDNVLHAKLISNDRGVLVPTSDQIAWFRSHLLSWFEKNQRIFPWRSSHASHYQRVVSEVLLQRTKADTVSLFWRRFISRFPNWTSITRANNSELEIVLRPIGLSRQKAPRLLALAKIIALKGGRFSRDREKVDALPGVGQYIGNAIMLFCHKQATPLLDVNMARTLERFFGPRKLSDIRYDPYLQILSHEVVQGPMAMELNWAVLDFGALICKSQKPLCDKCPLSERCLFYGREKTNLNSPSS